MYTSPKCPGRLTMPLQINFNCSTFRVFTLGNQAKQLSTDRPRQSHGRPWRYPSIIHHPSPSNKNTQTERHAEGRDGAELSPGASHSCRWGGKTLSGFIWVQCVSCSAQLQIETSEPGEGEEK